MYYSMLKILSFQYVILNIIEMFYILVAILSLSKCSIQHVCYTDSAPLLGPAQFKCSTATWSQWMPCSQTSSASICILLAKAHTSPATLLQLICKHTCSFSENSPHHLQTRPQLQASPRISLQASSEPLRVDLTFKSLLFA